MVLPRELSSLSDANDNANDNDIDSIANGETASNILKAALGGDELLLTTQGLDDDDDEGTRVGEDGDGIADELIKARRVYSSCSVVSILSVGDLPPSGSVLSWLGLSCRYCCWSG